MTNAGVIRPRSPYPGLDPFGFDQRDLFFGRDAEGRVVSAMIATEPLSILTGASGTGKSSLLRAAIVPNLLSSGWCVAYAHPGDDAAEQLKTEILAQAIPDLDRERAVIESVVADSSPLLRMDSRLSEARAWYASLAPNDPRRVHITGDVNAKIPRIPLLGLVMTGTVPVERATACFAELSGTVLDAASRTDPTLKTLENLVKVDSKGRERLLSVLLVDNPSLAELGGRLWRDWLQPVGWCGLIMILDQAEELYTAFNLGLGLQTDAGPAYRRGSTRDRLLDQQALAPFVKEARAQPLRLCFSLRPEWYTDLRVSLAACAPDENKAVHILTAMAREQAMRAVAEPPKRVGGDIDPAACEVILEALERQSGLHGIDPFLLGLVTHQAWIFATENTQPGPGPAHNPLAPRLGMRHLQKVAAGPDAPENAPALDEKTLTERLISGALLWLLHNLLDGLDLSQKFDTLEMLDTLFTTGGTRRIVERAELVERPLRPTERLQELLDRMDAARIVRLITRGDQTFVEIRHDRLAQPLLSHKARLLEQEKTSANTSTRYRSLLGKAIEMLLHFDGRRLSQAVADMLKSDVLPGWARETLRHNRTAIAWDAPAARVVLASLLHDGPALPDTPRDHASAIGPGEWAAYRDALRDLMVHAVSEKSVASPAEDVLEQELLRGLDVPLSALAGIQASQVRTLNLDARMLLLESVLRHSNEDLRRSTQLQEIDRWTRACLGQSIPS